MDVSIDAGTLAVLTTISPAHDQLPGEDEGGTYRAASTVRLFSSHVELRVASPGCFPHRVSFMHNQRMRLQQNMSPPHGRTAHHAAQHNFPARNIAVRVLQYCYFTPTLHTSRVVSPFADTTSTPAPVSGERGTRTCTHDVGVLSY